jgi:hypothetical protein
MKTADAGYLTRRLVDVSHDVIITEEDCGTLRGLVCTALKNGDEVISTLYERILGRVSVHDIIHPSTGELIVAAGLAIVGHLAAKLAVATHLGLLTLLAVTGHLLAATGHLSALLAAELALAAALAIIFTCLPFLYILQNQIGLILSKLPCCYIFIQFSLQLIRVGGLPGVVESLEGVIQTIRFCSCIILSGGSSFLGGLRLLGGSIRRRFRLLHGGCDYHILGGVSDLRDRRGSQCQCQR